MIKFTYPQHYNSELPRAELFPLLKAFEKGKSYTDKERMDTYGVSDEEFIFTEALEDSDVVILPMSWNYYVKTKKIAIAEKVIKNATKFNKTVYSYTGGDYGVEIPFHKNLIVLRPNGYRSKLKSNHKGIPLFIGNPLKKWYRDTEVDNYNIRFGLPKIGFCGQVNQSRFNALKEIVRICLRNIAYYLKFSFNAPQKLISSSYLRNRVLSVIKKSNLLEDNFIERKAYRAGVTNLKDRERTTKEFYDNIKNNEYTVCVRGAGNFSVRLYETLAMGRIPILVNTDCLYPLEETIPWKEHVVWVDEKEIDKLPLIIEKFHSKLSLDKRNELFKKNRELWETKLRLGSFFKTEILNN